MTALLDYSPPSNWLIAGGTNEDFTARTDRALAWFAEHKVDGTTVPIAGPVELDSQTREWRITQYVRGADGGLKAHGGDVVTRVLRRAVKSVPPWVVDEVARRVVADLHRDDVEPGSVASAEPYDWADDPNLPPDEALARFRALPDVDDVDATP